MFAPTSNPYKFKYLVTGITGPGIPCVYLPLEPEDKEVLFKKENKFTRPVPPAYLQEWMDEYEYEKEQTEKEQAKNPKKNIPDYVHPHQDELNKWEQKEFNRTDNGIWFWNNGVKTYITGDNYKYLTQWKSKFGYPDYWDADREVFYWMKFWEEDPRSYGGLYNTGRRTGKSTKMGFWIMNRVSTNFNHIGGMQGEDNTKIVDFYNKMVIDPFYELPYYSKPTYNLNTLQKKGIEFKVPPRRNKKVINRGKKLVLNSEMDYRTSEANKYDQAKLHSSVVEEPGKTLACDISDRWDFMKPCHELGIEIIGKAFWGTTVEFMDTSGKGGRAYQKICMRSDYDHRTELDQTISGLYAALMPADCVFQGCIDEFGIPERQKALKAIFAKRNAVKNSPKDYSKIIRKHPLNWNEVFYINADKCEFNVTILQDRKAELQMNPPMIRRMNLAWQDNKPFTKVVMSDDPANGWAKMSWIPKDNELKLLNNVGVRFENGKQKFFPQNSKVFCAGTDPIDYGVRIDNMSGDDMADTRRSRPVFSVKRRYDMEIDGMLDQQIMEQRAREKYPYKTNRRILMMDHRPNEPNLYFERSLLICWLLGTPFMCESQKPGIINYFRDRNCEDFLLNKYVPSGTFKQSDMVDGTPASTMMNQELTGLLATYIEYFGHIEPYIEFVEDYLLFDPTDTKKFDYAMCGGWTEVAEKVKPRIQEAPQKKITDYFRQFRRDGSVIK